MGEKSSRSDRPAAPEDPTPADELHAEVLSHWPPRKEAAGNALKEIHERVEEYHVIA